MILAESTSAVAAAETGSPTMTRPYRRNRMDKRTDELTDGRAVPFWLTGRKQGGQMTWRFHAEPHASAKEGLAH